MVEQFGAMGKCNYSGMRWMSVDSLILSLWVIGSHGISTSQTTILFGRDLTGVWLMQIGSLNFQVQLFIIFIVLHQITCLSVLIYQVWKSHHGKRCLDSRRCGFQIQGVPNWWRLHGHPIPMGMETVQSLKKWKDVGKTLHGGTTMFLAT